MNWFSRLIWRAALPKPRPDAFGQFMLWLSGAPIDSRPIKTRRDQLSAYAGWAYSAASIIAQDVRANPWTIWRRIGDRAQWERLPDNDISPILMRPNGMQTWGDFVEISQLHLDLSGETFWHVISDGGPANQMLGLEIVYPHWVDDPIQGDLGEIIGWPVTVPGRTRVILPASEVVQIKYPHPLDPLRGASPVEAYAVAHDMDIYARAYGSSLLKNRAVPELAISSDHDLTIEQADAIREAWLDRYRDPRNGPAVIGRGAKVQQLGLGIKDLAFLEMTNASRDLILSIYRVPASKLGLTTDFNRANAEAADATYKENCILPRLRRIEEVINSLLIPRLYGDRARDLAFEFESPVDADREFELRRANDMFGAGAITVNQYRERLGDDPVDGGDVYFVPAGRRIVDSLEPDIEPMPPREARARSQARRMPQPDALMELGELRFGRAQSRLERRMQDAVRSLFSREQKAVVAAIRKNVDIRAGRPETRDWIDEIIRRFEHEWRSMVADFIVRGYREGWGLLSAEISDSLSFSIFRTEAEQIARRLAGEKVANISQTTMDAIRTIIADAVASGASIDTIVSEISELYDGFRSDRATTIARTEMTAAINGGKEAHADEIQTRLGMRLTKTWVATDDDRTRESHVAANGQTVERNDAFELSGGLLMYPGDPSGPPEEIVNCRCTVVYQEEE